jgi:hypothetical protein
MSSPLGSSFAHDAYVSSLGQNALGSLIGKVRKLLKSLKNKFFFISSLPHAWQVVVSARQVK